MYKKIFASIILATVLLLAACGGEESKSDKEVVVDAFQSFLEAESFESHSTIGIELDVNINDPFVAPYIQMVNDIELSFDSVYDAERGLQEVVVYFEGTMAPMTISLEIPMLQDVNNNKIYFALDSLAENFAFFLGLPAEFTQELDGKLVEIDLDELDEAGEDVDYDEITKKAQDILVGLLNDKSDDEFSKNGDVYTISFTKDDLITLINELATEFDDTLSAQDLVDINTELEAAFEEFELNQFDVQLTVDGGVIKSDKFVIDVEFDAEGEKVGVALTVENTYSNINGDVTFSIDPDEFEVLDMDDLEALFEQLFYYGF